MRKPGKRAVTKQLEILNSIQGKGPIDWAVVLVLTSWPRMGIEGDRTFVKNSTIPEVKAWLHTHEWLEGETSVTPVEYLGYAELPEPPVKFKRTLYIGIALIVAGVIGWSLTS